MLDIMAQAKGLSVRRQGNVIWVAPRAEVAAREKLEYESKLAAQNLEPMQTRGFALKTPRRWMCSRNFKEARCCLPCQRWAATEDLAA